MSRRRDDPPLSAKVPANVERADEILFGLSGRQVATAAVTAVVLWLVWVATHRLIGPAVYLAVAAPIGLVGFGLMVGRRDGIALQSWLGHGLRFRREPHLQVAADAAIPPVPGFAAGIVAAGPTPLPMRTPISAVLADGVDLGSDGVAVLVEAGTVNGHLRSNAEQAALVAGFARWLHALDGPTQIVIASRQLDTTDLSRRLAERAPGLAHPAQETAARAHAAFLADLSAQRELLHRQVTVVVRDHRGVRHASARAMEAARLLAACEIPTRVVHGAALDTALADALGGTRTAGVTSEVITGRWDGGPQ